MKRLLIVLGAVVVAAVIAAGAWQVAYAQGQTAGRAEVAAARAAFIQERPGGAGANGRQAANGGAAAAQGGENTAAGRAGARSQGGGARSAPVAGTIEKVDGSTLTLTTETGSVTVTLNDQTQIHRQVAASASDLKAGDHVLVAGSRADSGDLTAATVQIQQP